ncbi:sorting nexin-16 [Euwallacea similis]|uniref:sorting nexin-16 n=1 Tax=Euwallacea similis TaxID=1736056 RepID=UPI003450FAE6
MDNHKDSCNSSSEHNTANSNMTFESAEEVSTDSDEYLSGDPLRYRNYNLDSSIASNVTILAQNMSLSDNNDNQSISDVIQDNLSYTTSDILNPVQIPIVGYEIMEERARFTVFKLRVENKINGDCWYVFRRYTDFVRLCNRFRNKFPEVIKHLPRKRWLKNNFDPIFLEERISGLQTLVNAILHQPNMVNSKEIQDFFCLNEPPVHSDSNEESRAIFEALEDTITDLKVQLKDKDALIDNLQQRLQGLLNENENLKKCLRQEQDINGTPKRHQ